MSAAPAVLLALFSGSNNTQDMHLNIGRRPINPVVVLPHLATKSREK